MSEQISREEFKAIQAKPKRSKYGAVRCELDGINFASQRERDCYARLKLREKLGEIANLTLQKRYPLHAYPSADEVGVYVADFAFREKGKGYSHWRVLDAKGFKTPLYRWKKKHMKAEYGIEIEEV